MAEKYYSMTDLVKLTDNLIAAMPTSFYCGIMAVRGGLVTAPAADVVPVVRCKDCRKGIPDSEHATEYSCYCIWHKPDWSCAGGKRKDGDGE